MELLLESETIDINVIMGEEHEQPKENILVADRNQYKNFQHGEKKSNPKKK